MYVVVWRMEMKYVCSCKMEGWSILDSSSSMENEENMSVGLLGRM